MRNPDHHAHPMTAAAVGHSLGIRGADARRVRERNRGARRHPECLHCVRRSRSRRRRPFRGARWR
ncbi:hypothetical protein CBM2613_B170234 [Cupriavidus taiwanensis]|uniref:Uncharacterized protein n=1 Tax=Cupriavidus taiwanensis TaxID=164546 RepID=A0A976G4Q3_9BURK|nr:hypothetical protein CBM2613_B170234 [Cupriavidus taiwanensis]